MADEEPEETQQEEPDEDQEQVEGEASEEEDEQEEGGGQKIMCFVSKEMVPINETVEIDYGPGKKVRVLPKYIKYDREEFEETAEA